MWPAAGRSAEGTGAPPSLNPKVARGETTAAEDQQCDGKPLSRSLSLIPSRSLASGVAAPAAAKGHGAPRAEAVGRTGLGVVTVTTLVTALSGRALSS
jgi:hypothetical protein